MADQVRVRNLAAACELMAMANHYLARAVPISPLPYGGAPFPLQQQLRPSPPLPNAEETEDDDEETEEEEETDDDDEETEEEEETDDDDEETEDDHHHDDVDDNRRAYLHDYDDDDDDIAFAVRDLLHLVYPLVAAAPPYPAYRMVSAEARQRPAWTCFLCANGIVFTVAVTICSAMLFRSSRRFLPTLLRAVLLAITLGAEVAAAVHLLPGTRFSTILAIIVILLHLAIYILASVVVCRRRSRLHPDP